ncbi:MAG: FHA domain-containing protein [Chloroflexota bacterium]|nr:MAG: FHA domain-containing protein [Chloroflexota bacterium]
MTPTEPVSFLTDLAGQEHMLKNPTSTLGRAVENDIVVANKRVSREHACITRKGRHSFLEDLGSTNGTLLNGERVLDQAELRDGDRITIGDMIFTFHDPDTTTRDTPLPELEVNVEAAIVRVNRMAVSLSPKEFSLIAYLFEHRGKVCPKDDIGRAVWSEYQEGIFDYQIENLVRRLRTKIETDPAAPQLLLTVRGLGYKLMAK